MTEPSYVIVTPIRNEAEHLETTIRCVVEQTRQPSRWLIVDDGSSDGTGQIADRWAEQISWIHVTHRPDRGHRAGSGGVEAFKEGAVSLAGENWDFLVNLDGDLRFETDYFARCLEVFDSDPDLGIAGGKVYEAQGDRMVHDPHPRFHVRGASKIYRRACWESVEDVVEGPGWDTLDEVKANQLGWQTRTLDEVPIYHLRAHGRAAGGWANWVNSGTAAYRSGYHPAFVLVRALRRLVRPPSLVAPAGLVYGYVSSALKGIERPDDPEVRRFVRQQQMNRLLGRKTMWR